MNSSSNKSWSGKKVIITGGAGFIGSHLAEQLVLAGAQVLIVDSLIPEYGGNLWNLEPIRDRVQLNISDVRDEHAMKYLIRGQDVLFNLAGQNSHLDSMTDPYTDLEINARAQLSILEACRKHNPGIKVIFSSTRQVYGKPQRLPVDEQHPLTPVDVNGINKVAGEWYHLLYNNVYGIRTAVLRLTNTYGPRMRVKDARQTFLGIWIKRILQGETIDIYGDGAQVRDFNFVSDVVEALLLTACSEAANGEVFNLGADQPLSLKDTAELLIKVATKGKYQRIPFPPDRKQIDIGDYCGDYHKIHTSLGWKPKTDFELGLRKTLQFYQQQGTHYFE